MVIIFLQKDAINYVHTTDNGRDEFALHTELDRKYTVYLVPLSAVDPKEDAKVIVGTTKDNVSSVYQWKRETVPVQYRFPVSPNF